MMFLTTLNQMTTLNNQMNQSPISKTMRNPKHSVKGNLSKKEKISQKVLKQMRNKTERV